MTTRQVVAGKKYKMCYCHRDSWVIQLLLTRVYYNHPIYSVRVSFSDWQSDNVYTHANKTQKKQSTIYI